MAAGTATATATPAIGHAHTTESQVASPTPSLPPVGPLLPAFFAGVPPLRYDAADAVEAAWVRLKHVADPVEQARLLAVSGLRRTACVDLVDFRALPAVRDAAFGWRDNFRGRTWIRPALASVLVQALDRLRAERPDIVLTVGDVAQPGCGQVAHGALIRMVEDATPDVPGSASQVLASVRPLLGRPVRVVLARGADFPSERDRFPRGDENVRVEQEVLGRDTTADGRAVVRVLERRFIDAPLPARKGLARRQLRRGLELATRTWQHGTTLERGFVPHDDAAPPTAVTAPVASAHAQPAGPAALVHVEHRVDVRRGRQVVVVSLQPVAGKLDPARVLEVRTAKWHPRKPGSFAGETRWRPDPLAAWGWRRTAMLSEAGHLTHLAGRDADLSFFTMGNADHLKKKVRSIDAAATWRWFELLDATARAAGTPIERILIARRVRSWIARKVPREARKSDLWRHVVMVSPGHDAHHHVRLAPVPGSADTVALGWLQTPRPDATALAGGNAHVSRQP
ncbi:MAG: hypothetical protein EXR79_06310 [Myxococcales bacterium]|nr:hypothetical protein [Myxococcales bacterium]